MCIFINVNSIVYPCKICHVNISNKDSAVQCNICQSWVHMKCNKFNHIDYKYLQSSNDTWYCLSFCSKIFPFGTLKNKDFISSIITATDSFSQVTNCDKYKESLVSLKPPSELVLLYGTIHKGCPHIFSDFWPPSPLSAAVCIWLTLLPPPHPFRVDNRSEKYSLPNILPSRFISYPFTLYYKLCYIIIIYHYYIIHVIL